MPSIDENRQKWNSYAWPRGGEEWSAAWGDSNQVWWGVLFPRIGRFFPTASVLEIASGFGRWIPYLERFCTRYTGIDVAEASIEACRQRFPHHQFHLTDGVSVPDVEERSISFCFSYDSLVHVNADTMRAYVDELGRVLSDDGVAFLHHSNLGAYEASYRRRRLAARFVPSWRLKKWMGLVPVRHWRDPKATAEQVRGFCSSRGLYCRQELITWIDTDDLMIDCFTLVTRTPMTYALLENTQFGAHAAELKACAQHYAL